MELFWIRINPSIAYRLRLLLLLHLHVSCWFLLWEYKTLKKMVAVFVFDPLGSLEQLDMSLVDSLHSPWYRCDVACACVCGKPLLAVMFHPIFISYPFFSLTTTPPLLCVITHSPRSNYCVCCIDQKVHDPHAAGLSSWLYIICTFWVGALIIHSLSWKTRPRSAPPEQCQ